MMMVRGFHTYEDTKTPFKAALWAGAVNLVLSLGADLLMRNSPWAIYASRADAASVRRVRGIC